MSTDKLIPSSVSSGHDDVQRETKRQRVKCHMRAHTVAKPSDIQQTAHWLNVRRADFLTSVGSKQDPSMQRDIHVCIRRPSCQSVARRIPNTSHPVTEPLGKSPGAQTTGRKNTSHHKTVFGFHPCNNSKWRVQNSAQESGPRLSNVDTGWRERDTH